MLKMQMDIHSLPGKNAWTQRKSFFVCFPSLAYVFIIGKGQKSWVSLPAGKGIRLTVAEERDRRLAGKTQ
jgi:hypothetical protein